MRPMHHRSGLTLVELVIAMALLSVMTVALTLSLDRQSRSMSAQTAAKSVELNAEMVLSEIVDRLHFARWVDTRTQLFGGVDPTQTAFVVEEIEGFPPNGTLVFDSGDEDAERVTYTELDPAGRSFEQVQRGMQCTTGEFWADGTAVHWNGLALWTANQIDPEEDEIDGISRELGREIFYRGGGTGLVYQVPIRTAGGTYFEAGVDDMSYGATIDGVDEPAGYYALHFEATDAIVEEALGTDLNRDGDTEDLFDLGHIRLLSWETNRPEQVQVAILCPNVIVQETCDYGSDLDGDGFSDPMFLLNENTGRLRLRLFSFSGWAGGSQLNRDEITVFLTNSIEG